MVIFLLDKSCYVIFIQFDSNQTGRFILFCCPFQLLSAALEEKDILFRQHAYPDQDHGIGMYHQHLYHTLTDFFKNDCFRDIANR